MRDDVSVSLVDAPRVVNMPDDDIAIFAGRLARGLSDHMVLQNGWQGIEKPSNLCGRRSNTRVVYGLGYEIASGGVDHRLDVLIAAGARTEYERRMWHVVVGFGRPGVFEGHLSLHGCEGWVKCAKQRAVSGLKVHLYRPTLSE